MWEIVGHWSYSGDPAASTKDAVRFLVGDTDDRERLCADEEIAYALSAGGSTQAAAAIVCQSIASRFAREPDTTINAPGGVSHTIGYSQRARTYQALADRYQSSTAESAAPYCGGISRSDKELRIDDDDRVAPGFVTGMFQHTGSAPSEPEWEDVDR